MLDWSTVMNYTPETMKLDHEPKASLGAEFVKRLSTMKMSRREFAKVSGISRQTMHKIEHEPSHIATDVTYQQLDAALEWPPGTAKGLAEGGDVGVIRWRIVENVQSMSLNELERLVRLMEAEQLGTNPDVLTSTDEVIGLVGASVTKARDSDTGDEETDDGQPPTRPTDQRGTGPASDSHGDAQRAH